MTRPTTKTEANNILNAVRAGCGKHIPSWIVNYCLAMTGDLRE